VTRIERDVYRNPKMAENAWGLSVQLDRAIDDYETSIRLDPRQVHPYNGLGNVYIDKHDPDRAIESYNKALRTDSSYQLAYNGRGNAYSDKKEYDRALADYDEAIRLDPRDAFDSASGATEFSAASSSP